MVDFSVGSISFGRGVEIRSRRPHVWDAINPMEEIMTSDLAARLIRSHGIDAWATDNPATVLAMDVTTERTPHGITTRAEPVLLVTDRREVMEWLGY